MLLKHDSTLRELRNVVNCKMGIKLSNICSFCSKNCVIFHLNKNNQTDKREALTNISNRVKPQTHSRLEFFGYPNELTLCLSNT